MEDVVQINSLWSEAFHFLPSDEHMIKFLRDRLLGLPFQGIQGLRIRKVNVYDSLTPHEIFTKSEFREFERGPSKPDKERYCFTDLKRTTKGGKKFVRTTGGGTWKLQSTVEIINGKDTVRKRQFSYQRSKSGSSGPAGPDNCNWVMYEYSFASPLKGNNIIDDQDIAICKVKKRTSTKRSRSGDDEEEKLRGDSVKIQTTRISDEADNPLLAKWFDDYFAETEEHEVYKGGDQMIDHMSSIQRIDDFLSDSTPETKEQELYKGGDQMIDQMSSIQRIEEFLADSTPGTEEKELHKGGDQMIEQMPDRTLPWLDDYEMSCTWAELFD